RGTTIRRSSIVFLLPCWNPICRLGRDHAANDRTGPQGPGESEPGGRPALCLDAPGREPSGRKQEQDRHQHIAARRSDGGAAQLQTGNQRQHDEEPCRHHRVALQACCLRGCTDGKTGCRVSGQPVLRCRASCRSSACTTSSSAVAPGGTSSAAVGPTASSSACLLLVSTMSRSADTTPAARTSSIAVQLARYGEQMS